MQAIKLLIARYGDAVRRASSSRKLVAEAISAATGVKVAAEEIEVGEKDLWVRVSGARRAAVFLNKAAAEAAAAEALGVGDRKIR